MSRKAQKRSELLIFLVAFALLASIAALTAGTMRTKLPNATQTPLADLPNFDFEAMTLAVALLLLVIVLYLAFGRARKAESSTQAWRSIPKRCIHPAVFGRLCRWKRPNSTDLAATVFHLLQCGILEAKRGTRTDASRGEIEDFLLTKVQPEPARLHPIDDAAIKMIFGIAAEGASSIWLSELHSYGRHHASSFSTAMRIWQTCVSRETKHSGYYDRISEAVRILLIGLAGTALLAGALAMLATRSPVPLVCGALVCAAAWIAIRHMPRHSQEGACIYAEAKALKAWLQENANRNALEGFPEDHSEGPFEGAHEDALGDDPESVTFAPELIPYAYVLREMDTAYAVYPGLSEFTEELTVCISSTAFAAESVVAAESLRALNSPVRGATLNYGGVTGLGSPEEDDEGLFTRRV